MLEIKYHFRFHSKREEMVTLRIETEHLTLVNEFSDNMPVWTKLEFNQCPHCPMDRHAHPYCPVASSLVDIVKRFDNISSYDLVDLKVATAERIVVQRTSAQKAIGSLLGILFPTSGCPHTAFFRPMAKFHLPLSTEEETIFRATGIYLLCQYFLIRQGIAGDFSLKGLKQIYENIHEVNIHITDRLRKATQTDSSLNAIIVLDVFTHAVSLSIEDQLEEIRHLFSPYLSAFKQTINNG
jgi:hypothetical protein